MDDGLTELDYMTDEEVMARVQECREMEQLRGIDLMGADRWDEDKKLAAFMAIFHPGRVDPHPLAIRRFRGH